MKSHDGDSEGCPPGQECHVHVKSCEKPTLMALGHDLDHLERHIDWYGSAVAKVPDVWGQARLTQYRQDFEGLMDPTVTQNQLDFKLGLQGSLVRSDQAFFAQATALSFAAQPKPPVIGRVESTKDAPALVPTSQTVNVVGTDPTTGVKTTTDTTLGQPPAPTAPPATPPPFTATAAGDPAKLLTTPDDAIKRELVAGRAIGFGDLKAAGIGIEPTLMVAQKKRYLDFLAQLRRENEGDDTADSRGYALSLVRIPVSLLPGKKTDEGHGAEVTMTVNSVLGDDLLPITFRTLVANDLLQQLGFPLTQFLNDRETTGTLLTPTARDVVIGLPVFNDLNRLRGTGASTQQIVEFLRKLSAEDLDRLGAIAQLLSTEDQNELKGLIAQARADARNLQDLIAKAPKALNPGQAYAEMLKTPPDRAFGAAIQKYALDSGGRAKSSALQANKAVAAFTLKINVPPVSFAPGLDNKTGFPTSQLLDVYGLSDCFQIAYAANAALQDSIKRQGYAHLPDIQGFLQQEVIAAYRFLAEPECAHLWQHYCTPDVVSAVRTRKLDRLQDLRAEYRAAVKVITQGTLGSREQRPYNAPGEYSTTAALAWCILVDSALLTDRLIRDMKETSTSKGRPLAGCDHWCPYFLPTPPPECRQAFNAYVALRWPVRVFALDPYTQDQNIADALSSRRETQLALSIAFTNGFIGVNTLTKFTRRLEAEYETIALNRTQVGFSHGENVFGWRFYPRFQSPDTESNLTVFARDQLIGGPNRNALLRQRRLEPGPRECVALVMMPSFVPYVTVDTVSNWFALANPKHKSLDHTQALKMSKTVQALKTCGPAITDAQCYRDGEFQRMLRRIEQLEARLPTQTMTFPVPVINTLGGFEMFSNGTTDLAPELYGWYGAPGVSTATTTTLFLVGDHFSPLHTKVIVGNKEAKASLLSRQVMRVDVDTAAIPLNGTYVTAHVASPYGVTRELLIPVAGAKSSAQTAAEGYKLKADTAALPYCKTGKGEEGKYRLAAQGVSDKVVITWDDALGVAPAKINVTLGFSYNNCPFTVDVPGDPILNDKGSYTITPTALKGVANMLFGTLNQFGPFTDATNPLTQGLSATVVITPVDGGRAVKAVTLSTPLKLTFECSICPPGTPAAPKQPAETTEPKKIAEPKKDGKMDGGSDLPPLPMFVP